MQRIKHIRWNMICLILRSVVGSPGEPTGIIDAHESDHIHTGLNQVVGFGWREHRLLPSTNNCRWLFVILAHHKIKQVQIIIYEMWRRETGRGRKSNETKVDTIVYRQVAITLYLGFGSARFHDKMVPYFVFPCTYFVVLCHSL